MTKMKITPAVLRELLDYDPDTGVFVWKTRDRKWFKSEKDWRFWNKKYPGRLTMSTIVSRGRPYLGGVVLCQRLLAHRAAWAHYYGKWPVGQIDHQNRAIGEASDNVISNLRDVSHQDNMRNLSLGANNKSGVCGVCWDKRREKWTAYIKVNSRSITLGRFDLKVDAVAARKAAEAKFEFHPNHGRAAA